MINKNVFILRCILPLCALWLNATIALAQIMTPSDQTVCFNGQFSIEFPESSLGVYQSVDGNNWVLLPRNGGSGFGWGSPYVLRGLAESCFFRAAYSSSLGFTYSNVVHVTVLPDFKVGAITGNQTICAGSAADAITGTAPAGGTGSYAYQWEDSTALGWKVRDSDSGPILQSGILTETTAFRRKDIDRMCGEQYTNTVVVVVRPKGDFGGIYADQTICYNAQPQLLTGTPPSVKMPVAPTYQWEYSTTAGKSWAIVQSATAEDYLPGKLTTTTYYRRQITDQCGTGYSNTVTVNVLPQFDAGTISGDHATCVGVAAKLISGKLPTGGTGSYRYSWEASTDGKTWNVLAGAQGVDYQPGVLSSTTYFRRKADDSFQTGYSNMVKVIVGITITGGTIGTDHSVCYNSASEAITTVTAPLGGTGAYTYVWLKSLDDCDWEIVAGAVQESYKSSSLIYKAYFKRKVIDGCAYAYSNSVAVTVNAALTAGAIGADQVIACNAVPAPLSVVSAPTGGTGTYTYQWQKSLNGTDWISLASATLQDYQPEALAATTFFRRLTTSGTCGPKETNTVKITVDTQMSAGKIGSDQAICKGMVPAAITTLDQPTGAGAGYTVRWQQSANGVQWADIAGATAGSYQPVVLDTTTLFRKVVTTVGKVDLPTNAVTVTVNKTIGGFEIGADQSVCPGSDVASLAIVNPSTGTYSYQWQQSSDKTDWTAIAKATESTYVPVKDTVTRFFRVKVTGLCGDTLSNNVAVTVLPRLTSANIKGTQSIAPNGVPKIITGELPTGGSGVYKYQWESSTDGTTWTLIANATALSYQSPALAKTTHFRRLTNALECGSIYSNVAIVSVVVPLKAGTIGTDQTVCFNAVPKELQGTAATGGTGVFAYQWQSSTDGNLWVNMGGKTALNYQPVSIVQPLRFRRMVVSGSDSAYSNIVKIAHLAQVAVPTLTANSFYCQNSSVALKLTSLLGVTWYDQSMAVLSNQKTYTFTARQPVSLYYSATGTDGCESVPKRVDINVEYAQSHLNIGTLDASNIENGQRVTFYPQMESNLSPDVFKYQWEFSHLEKGLYETMYAKEPSQYFHWTGWHSVKLIATTPNGCAFTESRDKLFFIKAETPMETVKSWEFAAEEEVQPASQPDVLLYPNPVRERVIVKTNLHEILTVRLVSLSGNALLISSFMGGGEHELPLDALAPGIYLVTVQNGNGHLVYRGKITKQ